MKKFLFIFCVLATVAGVLPSCDDEIDETPSNGKSENVVVDKKKLLVYTSYKSSNGDPLEFKYEYDTNGKTTNRYSPENKNFNFFNYVDSVSTENGRTTTFFKSTSFNSDGSLAKKIEITKFFIGDDVSFVSSYASNYTYDENKHLVSFDTYDVETGEKIKTQSLEWVWENGNIIKYIEPLVKNGEYADNVEWLYEYTNVDVTTPLNNKTDFLFYGYGGQFNCINRYGMACENLPVIIINAKTGTKQRIDWTFDKYGYPIKVEFCWAEDDGNPHYDKNHNKDIIATMDFVWE